MTAGPVVVFARVLSRFWPFRQPRCPDGDDPCGLCAAPRGVFPIEGRFGLRPISLPWQNRGEFRQWKCCIVSRRRSSSNPASLARAHRSDERYRRNSLQRVRSLPANICIHERNEAENRPREKIPPFFVSHLRSFRRSVHRQPHAPDPSSRTRHRSLSQPSKESSHPGLAFVREIEG